MQTVFRENFTNTDMQLQQRRREFPRFRAKTYRVLSTASRSVRSKRNSFAEKTASFHVFVLWAMNLTLLAFKKN